MELKDCIEELNSFLLSTLKERLCLNYDADDEIGSYREFLKSFETDCNLPNQVICAAYGFPEYYGFSEDYGEVIDALCKIYGKDVKIAALRELCEWTLRIAADGILKNFGKYFPDERNNGK